MAMARHRNSETFRITHELELIDCKPQGSIPLIDVLTIVACFRHPYAQSYW